LRSLSGDFLFAYFNLYILTENDRIFKW